MPLWAGIFLEVEVVWIVLVDGFLGVDLSVLGLDTGVFGCFWGIRSVSD
jgi:hypothetical protein